MTKPIPEDGPLKPGSVLSFCKSLNIFWYFLGPID